MKKIQASVVSAALAIGMAIPAWAGVNDPEVIIYRFPGVRDNGGTGLTGFATIFHCTNFSGVDENVRIVTRSEDGTLKSNFVTTLSHLKTVGAATHAVFSYSSFGMGTGAVSEGTAAIAATSTNIICTAMVLDAATARPDGVALRGIRFNPVPGSQE